MARNIDDAFNLFLSWLTPTVGETTSAASHRASIEARLKSSLGMSNFFRTGSFGHGTSVRGFSDIDYFAVFPTDRLKANSSSTLQIVRSDLQSRFPTTPISVRSPAVSVPFGSTISERHEITPADFIGFEGAHRVYDIPDRYDGWMRASPAAHNAWVSQENDRLLKKLKQLIRLIKLWNYQKNAGIRSFYIEMRVTEYALKESYIQYSLDVRRALRHIFSKNLAAMQDPMGVSGYVYACSDAAKTDALSKLSTALTRADKAIEAEQAAKIEDAFYWWNLLYSGDFPSFR